MSTHTEFAACGTSRTTRAVGLVLVCAALSAACGPSLDDFVAERRESARAVLKQVEAIATMARQAPPISDFGALSDPGPMAICDLLVGAHREAGCDTWVIDQPQLDSPGRFLDPEPVVRFGLADWLVLTTSLVETGRLPPNASYPEGAIESRITLSIGHAFSWLQTVRYVIVVRPGKVEVPALAADQKSYKAGSYTGDAMVFALGATRPRLLGAVPFSYKMGGDVKLKMWRGELHQKQLDRVYAQGVREALVAELAESLRQLERQPPPKAPNATP
ncbi:MAG: hypothetical protein JNJ59_07105 [Deltaproteobacteria bacterium]|nr:hypothetical protein [Deltaproteobacteria bacterium]